jgi:uncharacterized glyoxalase superfamily protein PhnB
MAKKKSAARKARRPVRRAPARKASPRKASAPRRPRAVPPGFHTVTVNLVVKDAGRAMDFWKQAFGAEELMRMPGADGRGVLHGEVKLGDTILFVNDEMGPGWARASSGENPPTATLFVYLDGADALFARAVQAGCRVLSPMADMFWGDRTGVVADPFGVVWTLARHVKDVSPEEARVAGEKFAKGMEGGPPA